MKKSYTLSLEKKEWNECLHSVFDKKKKDIKIDGFRKGAVPYDVYVKKVGQETLYMEAADAAVDILYARLLSDKETITPAATPEIDIKSISNDGITIGFTLLALPEVKLGKYKDLGIKKSENEVTDEEIDHEIGHLREQFVEVRSLGDDAVLEDGNVAIIDFEGFAEGKPFQGGRGEGYSLTIGSHTFIPGFEEGLVGLKKGDKKDINVTFPDNYPNIELKGKDVVFKVEIKEVKERVLPEFDKAFFEDLNVGGVESLEDLKKYVSENMKASREKQYEEEYLFKCLDKVVEDAKFEIPEEMTNDEINNLTREFAERLQYQGLKLEDYLKFCNTSMDDFKATLKDEANKRIGYRLIMDAVVEKEKLEITDEELDKALKETSEKYGMKLEDFEKEIGSKEIFRYDLLMKKAMEVITK